MKSKNFLLFSSLFLMLICATGAAAQNKKINVSFKAGTTNANYSSTVSKYDSVDYYITAKSGQKISVKLTAANTSLYFLVTKAGGVEAIADDARDATEWSGELPEDGNYIVRVYLFRNAARTNKRPVKFKIDFGIN